MSDNLDKIAMDKALTWLDGNYDEATKTQVKWLIDNDKSQLIESFYKDLEFGTGGLRGIMGVGTNRMNIYTVGMATQGLANYLKKQFPKDEIRVAIAHDSRHNSRRFSEHVAAIFAANGFRVFLFDSLRPTPELSFAIRHLKCHSGVNITASHNPKEYNGYKAYWNDGAQVTAPHDVNIIAEVEKIKSPDQVLSKGGKENISMLDEKFDREYLKAVLGLSLSPEAVASHSDMKIVYTPLHGAGVVLVPASLKNYGFGNIHTVKEQDIVDGDFPTVKSPNPEERATMKMAMDLAEKIGAELILATDPDADRIGVGMRDDKGEYILLNGNQTCVLLTYYLLKRWSESGMIRGKEYIVKTIVTSEMMVRIAEAFKVKHFDCLTGFKYIATIIRENEGKLQYIGGGEESYGYLAGDFVRDKDAVSACSLFAEATAWAKTQGMSLYGLLKDMYVRYGFYKEGLVSIVREGKDGQEQIAKIMEDYRKNPPKSICGSKVTTVRDYLSQKSLDVETGAQTPLTVGKSNVLQFLTSDGTIVSVRPSGTEPKIKFYFGVREDLPSVEMFDEVGKALDAKIECMKKELNLV